ncbi:MAG: MBL fold metallo-hydrolase [Candidatus Heimdallarchaeota archaeon]|nr:MBL fold metallo-hydrolase [Candidatus Heimdallarchaeota archaeon]
MTITLRLLGHASFKMTVGKTKIYIDPYGGGDDEYKEKADLILASHKHGDHSSKGKINLMKQKSTILITSSDNKENLEGNVVALDPGQKYEYQDITIYGVPGYNVHRFRSPGEPFHPKSIQTAFVIEAEGKRIYFAGDTDFIEEMKDLKNIDYALLPIDGHYTMSPEEALAAVGAFKPKNVIPMHWREQKPEDFKQAVEKKYPEIAVKVILPGNSMDL